MNKLVEGRRRKGGRKEGRRLDKKAKREEKR